MIETFGTWCFFLLLYDVIISLVFVDILNEEEKPEAHVYKRGISLCQGKNLFNTL